jgi:transposase
MTEGWGFRSRRGDGKCPQVRQTVWKLGLRDSDADPGAIESSMTHIAGHDRDQILLLPEAVDDYVAADNPVRFIDAFVDGLDLSALGFGRVVPEATGRPGYAPGDLLKLYIYGYLNRVRSSRRLEAETHRNLEVIWLLRHLRPDFKTIADFRRDNRAAFRSVFREFVLLCRQLDLFGRELLAVDGTRIKAVNNKDRNFTRTALTEFIRDADERLADYVRWLDEADTVDNNAGGGSRAPNLAEKIAVLRAVRDRHHLLLAELERTGESQISLTDRDSRAMAGHTRVAVGYNAQLAVDAKYKLIVEQEVTNQVVDMGLLKQTAEPARAVLGIERIDVVADRGYFKIEDIVACDEAGLTPHVPKPQRGSGVRRGFFHKDEFRYDPERDVFTCPGGQTLEPHHYGRLRDLQRIGYSNPAACPLCPLRARCTTNVRRISRLENEAVLDRMAARLRARPELLDRRRETVEHPFGSIKQWMNQGAFLMRGLDNVRGEFSLTALVYNLRRALNIVGVAAMIAAVRG